MSFALAACAEMLWPDRPLAWRASRLTEMGFGVGLWNWPDWDLDALLATGANFTIMNGYVQGRLTDDEGADILIASAAETIEVGKRLNVDRPNLRDHPGCPFNSTADVLELVSTVNRPQLRINLDLYHTQIGEGDLIRWCAACLPWIGEVQVADNPGRCEPGTGEINYPAIASALADMGYSGPVALEAHASADAETALNAFRSTFTL